MTPAGELLVELFRRGVTVKADGDTLRFSPRSRVTPEMVEQLRQHKAAILKTLSRVLVPAGPAKPSNGPTVGTVYETLPAPRESAGSVDAGWLDGGDELPDLEPCPRCGSLEQWESAVWPRPWRCLHCDPPVTALRLLDTVAQIRARSPRPAQTGRTRTSPGERWQAGPVTESAKARDP